MRLYMCDNARQALHYYKAAFTQEVIWVHCDGPAKHFLAAALSLASIRKRSRPMWFAKPPLLVLPSAVR